MNIGFFTDAMADRSLVEVLDWLTQSAPEVTRVEVGTGGYSPSRHIDRARSLADPSARAAWLEQIPPRSGMARPAVCR